MRRSQITNDVGYVTDTVWKKTRSSAINLLETARRESLSNIMLKFYILYSVWNTGCGNDNLDRNDLQMSFSVIKSGTNRKLVYAFLLGYRVTSKTATNQNGHDQNGPKRKRPQTKTATKRYQNGHI